MKKLITLFIGIIFFSVSLFSQATRKITELQEVTVPAVGSALFIRDGGTGDVIRRVSTANLLAPTVKLVDTLNMLAPLWTKINAAIPKADTTYNTGFVETQFRADTTRAAFRDSINALRVDIESIVVGEASMVYPGAGIPLSTGSAWGTSITDNSAAWNSFVPASGSLTLSGADVVTITTTAETNVTLPTSGTLATTQNIADSLNAAFDNAVTGVDLADSVNYASGYMSRYDGVTGLALKQNIIPDSVAYTSNSTLALTDANKIIMATKATSILITIPTNTTAAIPIGTTINFVQAGAGIIVFKEASGVNLYSKKDSIATGGMYSWAALYKRGTNNWLLYGDIED